VARLSYRMRATPVSQMDVERLKGYGLQLYFKRQLRHLEARIAQLSRQHNPRTGKNLRWTLYRGMEAGEKAWDDLLELRYLEALREAILETLASL